MHVPLPIASQELSDIWDLHAITDEYRGLFAMSKVKFYFGLGFCWGLFFSFLSYITLARVMSLDIEFDVEFHSKLALVYQIRARSGYEG